MVTEFLAAQGIKDERVLAAMKKIPRHLFVEEALADMAYQPAALPLPGGQSISHPLTVARMSELLALKGTERVLEIGTGSGYQTAVLSELSEKVFSVECLRHLLVGARQRLEKLGYHNVLIKLGDGGYGWPEMGPYDAIIVTAGIAEIPPRLEDQLAEGGRMVIPVGNKDQQEIIYRRKLNGTLSSESSYPCKFVAMVSDYS